MRGEPGRRETGDQAPCERVGDGEDELADDRELEVNTDEASHDGAYKSGRDDNNNAKSDGQVRENVRGREREENTHDQVGRREQELLKRIVRVELRM